MPGTFVVLLGRLARVAPSLRDAVRAAAFWAGILLPLAYAPLLVVPEVGHLAGLDLLAALVATNALAVVLGHGHDPGRGGATGRER